MDYLIPKYVHKMGILGWVVMLPLTGNREPPLPRCNPTRNQILYVRKLSG